jgi:hypothetical protein
LEGFGRVFNSYRSTLHHRRLKHPLVPILFAASYLILICWTTVALVFPCI